ncbi:MAG: ABC transporter substrate-binding protein, partial [Clostridia bacterium]|nr:ABC transporter substrate-binding protein [Clostridia bacterium]
MADIWKLTLGRPSEEGLLSLSGARADESLLSDSPCPPPAAGIVCEQVRDRFTLRVPLGPDERLYGLGLNFHRVTLNYSVRHLRADHYGGRDNGRTHAPVPFFLSDGGWGLFVDCAENISFYMGGAVRVDDKNPPPEKNRGRDDDWACNQRASYIEISMVETGAVVYLFRGDTPRDVTALFIRLTGGGCLPPKWGLGLWHRVHIRHDEGAVMKELDEFASHGLHVDVLGLEPGWQSNSYPCTLEWDRERFPDPAAFVSRLKARGTRVNLWENLYISRKSAAYNEILPYSGSHQVWGGAVPDITMPQAREILSRHHADNMAGVSGYKADECDGYDEWLWPDHARFPSGRSATAVRNVYGVRLQRMLAELYRGRDERTFGLARAANAGGAGLPFCIYNDCYDFSQFLTGLASAGFCGVLWVPEVRDAATAEEWVRRFQLSALSPMLMLNAWASGAKPWKFPEAESIIADTIRLRRALLPYLYNAFHAYQARGIPPFRPLAMDYSAFSAAGMEKNGRVDDTQNPYGLPDIAEVVDQYMIGDCLMAAPMQPGQSRRSVLLPPGRWYDAWTARPVAGPVLDWECPLDRIPLFVREGGMIPLLREDGTLEVR